MPAIATSADGANVFLALEDTAGKQVIAYAARSNLSSWSAAYQPGGGSASNVAAGGNLDEMVFYGNFGTDVGIVEYSISGDSTSDISPASLGSNEINALQINPSDETEIIATVDADEDLIQTTDGGSNWSTLDSALGFDCTALWVLWSGAYFPHRVFTGGHNGTDIDLLYSPNEGNDQTNYEDATLGALSNICNVEAVAA